MGANTFEVSDADFDTKVLQAPTPVLVDFWAPWCGPCRMIAPVLEELAGSYDGKVVVAKLNVDDNPATAQKFGIRGIPTMIMFKGGEQIDQIVGAAPKPQLQAAFDKAIA